MMTKVERLIFDDGFADGAIQGRSEGRSEGERLQLIEQIQKKCRKGKSVSAIADELEAEEKDIQPIVACVMKQPDASKEEIFEQLQA